MENRLSPDRSIPENHPNVDSLRLALQEMQSLYALVHEAAKELDGKADTLLGSASLILTLITTLQLTLAGTHQPWYYWAGLVLAFSLYLSMILSTLFAISPRVFGTPIKASWEVLDEYVFQVSESQALLNLVSAYEDNINANKKILDQKARQVKLATFCLGMIVLLLVLLSMVAAR